MPRADVRGLDRIGRVARRVVSGNVATIGFIAGGVGLVGGAVLWLSARREPSSAPSVQVGLGPGSMQVLGTW